MSVFLQTSGPPLSVKLSPHTHTFSELCHPLAHHPNPHLPDCPSLGTIEEIFRDLFLAAYLFGHIVLFLFYLNWIYYNPTVGLCISIIVTTFSYFFLNCLFPTNGLYSIPSHLRRRGGVSNVIQIAKLYTSCERGLGLEIDLKFSETLHVIFGYTNRPEFTPVCLQW